MYCKRYLTNIKSISAYVKHIRYSSEYKIPSDKDQYTDTPQYPPILDISERSEKQREIESWYKKIERQQTIEEKLFEINVPRYWGWKCLMLREGQIPFNSLNFIQYVTRTHVLPSEPVDLPGEYKATIEQSKVIANDIKGALEEEIAYQISTVRGPQNFETDLDREKAEAELIVNTIHRVISREISSDTSHIGESVVDYNPRLEAFWSVGGIDPPESVKKRRKADNKDISKELLEEPINRWVQYLGNPTLQVRHENLLQPVWGPEVTGNVPKWTLEPENIGFTNEYRHGTSIPGFWPGDSSEFGLLSYNLTNHLKYRPPSYGLDEAREALVAQGILASFSWVVALAAYQGFSPFSEITYPTVTQTVLTNGKDFSFMVYQLNTNLVHSEFAQENPKTNICWCSPSRSLYERVEDGKVLGLNEEVLSMLLQFYLNKPVERNGVNLKPFLGKDIQRVAQYEDDEKRRWLEKEFKHFSANRPRHRKDLIYEMYEWERIYKVEHQTRPMDARRRPFELRQHPFERKMSDHPGQYIPKALRPDKDLPKWRQKKFAKSYYPE